jgi:hypothetical protein
VIINQISENHRTYIQCFLSSTISSTHGLKRCFTSEWLGVDCGLRVAHSTRPTVLVPWYEPLSTATSSDRIERYRPIADTALSRNSYAPHSSQQSIPNSSYTGSTVPIYWNVLMSGYRFRLVQVVSRVSSSQSDLDSRILSVVTMYHRILLVPRRKNVRPELYWNTILSSREILTTTGFNLEFVVLDYHRTIDDGMCRQTSKFLSVEC